MRALLLQAAGAAGLAAGIGWQFGAAWGVIAASAAVLAFGITEER